ncbi:hypothetical protein CBW65_22925 [Tumebacillus avium]|uniref:Carrier domain-containing protein n=1 Tax=Tumebacillus avium TaxID=1903704 RepID=A0A1Y0ISP2_9BACL|nr:non-ribosomal peptide synthetase [Tumebacillus avium]ARU63541.1 hypothetical protein CBW65_22925 [Tumebacillus avium]
MSIEQAQLQGGQLAEEEEVVALPVSFAQQRLWFFDQFESGSALYNVPLVLRLKGKLSIRALEQSLEQIIERHESLRTTFATEDGEPVQVIHEQVEIPLQFEDLTDRPESAREAAAEQLIRAYAHLPFDLGQGPLLRTNLLRLAEHDHALLLTMHHIVSDGWSLGVLLQELTALYTSLLRGESGALPNLPVQYADFSIWQRDWLEGDVLAEQLAYWKAKLGGTLPVLQVPTDHLRPAQQTYNGTSIEFAVSKELTERLQAISRSAGATLYMTLLTAFKTLLHHYSGQEDIIVGSPIAGRNRAEIEGLIGFFVNSLVLRTDLSGAPSFRELLGRVKETTLGAYSHQDVPFEKLVEELQPERSMGHAPLFQAVFALQNDALQPIEWPELTVHPQPLELEVAKFELSLGMHETPDGLAGVWEYNTDLFEEKTAHRMIGNFVTLLESIAAQPDLPVGELSILTGKEREHLLFGLNDTAVEFPEHLLLHQLFEQQAERTPHNIAAVYGEQEMTYAELETRANQLAHQLRAMGVGPDTAVGVCIERSLELVIALVAILKAGGAYLPLDTEAPAMRMHQVLTDANAPVCLSQERLRENLPTDACTMLFLDTDWAKIARQATDRPAVDVTPEHLVSIYYTSGSTGKPKGVASTHRGWVNRMAWMQRQHGLQAEESVLQKTTLTFDDAAVEFYWPLMVGARIALLEPVVHRDPRAILDAAIRWQVAVLQFVPSMLNMVLDTITPEDRAQLNCLRVVVSSGEALRPDTVRLFLERMNGILTNTWGATEVSIDSTIHICSEADVRATEVVAVGRPIDNNQVYILNKHLQPVPIGVAGDLYLAGVGLARCYLNNPERTAEAFIANPFVPGERMYKTGDRGYYREDGSIQFLGREDNQIKLRGMRVELGEIESAIDQHQAVKESVVIAHEAEPGVKRLLAYYTLQAGEAGEPSDIRKYLKELLPEYMVPAFLIPLEAFPLNANGKVDRKELPLPDQSRPELETEFAPPETMVEELIAEIWSEVLGVKKIGVYDNFFALGGHSLLATQVISRLRKALEVNVSLRVLFEKPTILELAEAMEDLLLEEFDEEDGTEE